MGTDSSGCPVDGACFCTGACRADDNTWVPYDPPYEPSLPSVPEPDSGWGGSTTTILDQNPTYYWAIPEGEVESNAETLRFISLEHGAQLDQFYEGHAVIRGDFIPSLINWGEEGFTIVAIDDSRTKIQQQIRDLA